jgi:hypothetical protein
MHHHTNVPQQHFNGTESVQTNGSTSVSLPQELNLVWMMNFTGLPTFTLTVAGNV